MQMQTEHPSVVMVGATSAEKRVKRSRPTEPLTRTEHDVLLGLERAIRLHGNPSIREITACSGDGYYGSTVHKYLKQLELKGYVAMASSPGRMRGIRLLFTAPKSKAKGGAKNER